MNKKETKTEYARRRGMALVTIKIKMQHLLPEQRVEGTISKIGEIQADGPVSIRAAQLIWDAYVCGGANKLTPVEEMLMDLLNGVKGPHEIHEQTGMSMERCKEIYAWMMGVEADRRRIS